MVEDYYRLHKFNVGEVAKMCKAKGEGQESMTRLGEAGGADMAMEKAVETAASTERVVEGTEDKVVEAQTEKVDEAPETQGEKPAEEAEASSAVL